MIRKPVYRTRHCLIGTGLRRKGHSAWKRTLLLICYPCDRYDSGFSLQSDNGDVPYIRTVYAGSIPVMGTMFRGLNNKGKPTVRGKHHSFRSVVFTNLNKRQNETREL
jgi:hypothetical protein